MKEMCQACETQEGQVISHGENLENETSYCLCNECHQRLISFSLRPLEWYNLAKRYSWQQFYLHDDFYNDRGKACQAEQELVDAKKYPAPTLRKCSKNAEMLLDYSITQWHLTPKLKELWNALDKEKILKALQNRFETANIAIRHRIMEICAVCLGPFGRDFVNTAWQEYPENIYLESLTEASAACLPETEALERTLNGLSKLEGSEKYTIMLSLSYYRSPKVLDWIEANVTDNVFGNWGNLAAASKPDWKRIKKWLQAGRPLSLVALDTLLALIEPKTPVLIEMAPTLMNPPILQELTDVLTASLQQDNTPRVRKNVEKILNNTNGLLGT